MHPFTVSIATCGFHAIPGIRHGDNYHRYGNNRIVENGEVACLVRDNAQWALKIRRNLFASSEYSVWSFICHNDSLSVAEYEFGLSTNAVIDESRSEGFGTRKVGGPYLENDLCPLNTQKERFARFTKANDNFPSLPVNSATARSQSTIDGSMQLQGFSRTQKPDSTTLKNPYPLRRLYKTRTGHGESNSAYDHPQRPSSGTYRFVSGDSPVNSSSVDRNFGESMISAKCDGVGLERHFDATGEGQSRLSEASGVSGVDISQVEKRRKIENFIKYGILPEVTRTPLKRENLLAEAQPPARTGHESVQHSGMRTCVHHANSTDDVAHHLLRSSRTPSGRNLGLWDGEKELTKQDRVAQISTDASDQPCRAGIVRQWAKSQEVHLSDVTMGSSAPHTSDGEFGEDDGMREKARNSLPSSKTCFGESARKCPSCSKQHDGTFGTGKFCSLSCSKIAGAIARWRGNAGSRRNVLSGTGRGRGGRKFIPRGRPSRSSKRSREAAQIDDEIDGKRGSASTQSKRRDKDGNARTTAYPNRGTCDRQEAKGGIGAGGRIALSDIMDNNDDSDEKECSLKKPGEYGESKKEKYSTKVVGTLFEDKMLPPKKQHRICSLEQVARSCEQGHCVLGERGNPYSLADFMELNAHSARENAAERGLVGDRLMYFSEADGGWTMAIVTEYDVKHDLHKLHRVNRVDTPMTATTNTTMASSRWVCLRQVAVQFADDV